MGMDVVRRLGGVFVDGVVVKFGTQDICSVAEDPGGSHGGDTTVDKDFKATFDEARGVLNGGGRTRFLC